MKDLLVSKKEIEPGIHELVFNVTHSGKCQCRDYIDCDCAYLAGKVLNTYVRYSNGILNKGGNLRLYKDLIGCKLSLSAHCKQLTI